jgi:CRP/FNR family cyclic AMP-dependent transcriptional regulator
MGLYEMIKDMNLFDNFSDEEKKSFSDNDKNLHKFSQSEYIIHEGENTTALYLLIEGSCLITKTEENANIRLSKLKAGEIFGEMSFFSKKPRQSNVLTSEDSLVLEMDTQFFQSLDLSLRDKIKDHLIRVLITRLDKMNDAIMKISKLMRH